MSEQEQHTSLEPIRPIWPAPPRVKAFCTTRNGGVSGQPYASLNLALHVGDDPANVQRNRQLLAQALGLPESPCWLTQTHGIGVVRADEVDAGTGADAAYTTQADVVCVVMTADCLPILLCVEDGSAVAAVHAGWRGLHDGVIAAALTAIAAPASRLLAWIGPGIGRSFYRVGAELRDRFCDLDSANAGAFERRATGWHADLPALAERQLRGFGVGCVTRYRGCTYADDKRFFSYRRDGDTGRMASLIWRSQDDRSYA